MLADNMKELFLAGQEFVRKDKNIGAKLSSATNVVKMATMIYGGNSYNVIYEGSKSWYTNYITKENSSIQDITTHSEYSYNSTRYTIEIWGTTPWGYLLKRYMTDNTNNIEIYQATYLSVLTKIGGVLCQLFNRLEVTLAKGVAVC